MGLRMKPMDYLGVNHIGVAVANLDEAIATYRDVLGFRIEKVEELPERGLKVAFVDAINTHIELISPLHDTSEVSKFLQKRGSGIHHICMEVPSIDAAITQLKQQGAQLLSNEAQPGAGNTKVVFVHPKGACGVLLEIAQMPKDKNS